jgi:hypothetical protein
MAGALDNAEVEETESLQTSAPKAPVTYERSVTTHDLHIYKPRVPLNLTFQSLNFFFGYFNIRNLYTTERTH